LGVRCSAKEVVTVSHTRRTYIYYSDHKILEQKRQVPLSRRKRAKERLKDVQEAEVTVLGTGAKVGIGPRASEPILRTMQEVWVDLADERRIGTFDEPSEYFYGKLVFYYGLFRYIDPPVFFLVGATDQTIVALGGSRKYVRGHRGKEIPAAEDAEEVVMEPDVAALIYKAEAAASDRPSIELPPPAPDEDIRAVYVAKIFRNWKHSKSAKMEYEVLARRELESSVSPPTVEAPTNVLVGTPIFVAQA
jgi:hypothetical protein